jgi:hypothetical protein
MAVAGFALQGSITYPSWFRELMDIWRHLSTLWRVCVWVQSVVSHAAAASFSVPFQFQFPPFAALQHVDHAHQPRTHMHGSFEHCTDKELLTVSFLDVSSRAYSHSLSKAHAQKRQVKIKFLCISIIFSSRRGVEKSRYTWMIRVGVNKMSLLW